MVKNAPGSGRHPNIDVQISRIHTIYFGTQTDWSRPEIMPRYANGLIYIVEGSIRYDFEAGSILTKAGDVLLFPKDLRYAGVSLSAKNSFYVIDFETVDENGLEGFPLPLVMHPEGSEIRRTFEHIIALWDGLELDSLLECRAQIYKLFGMLLRVSDSGAYRSDIAFVNGVVSYIRENYMHPELYIGEIAEQMCISESQLRRLFRKVVHQSPLEYLLSVRISHAKDLLLYSRKPISEIAEECGFTSFYYFCRVFKRQTGLTPSQFRKL